jgi:hypothetical protein
MKNSVFWEKSDFARKNQIFPKKFFFGKIGFYKNSDFLGKIRFFPKKKLEKIGVFNKKLKRKLKKILTGLQNHSTAIIYDYPNLEDFLTRFNMKHR